VISSDEHTPGYDSEEAVWGGAGTMSDHEPRIPEALREDVRRAIQMLEDGGCTAVYLFGSAARGESAGRSDIDLAIRGCPRGRFFALLGRLLMQLEHPVDLANLDSDDPFADYLGQQGELVEVG
jgi:predicted nucleotidyltransferase